jgi:UDP-N-acetylglucosamine 2-epimerase (non-hydrolysing)
MTGALTAYYHRVEIAHLEAGLRSHNKFSPYPEEINRILTSHMVDYHFAPTENAVKNLLIEGINNQKIFLVGNTVIDALFLALDKIKHIDVVSVCPELSVVDFSKRMILVTGHRRESFGEPLKNICLAIREISAQKGVEVVFPVHLNPNVVNPVYSILGDLPNVHLTKPVSYPVMVYLMSKSYFILTDSGGVQEEAPSLGKPVLVMRDVTERNEGINAGVTMLVGTRREKIVLESLNMLNDECNYQKMATGLNPYGDGKSSRRIVEILDHNR